MNMSVKLLACALLMLPLTGCGGTDKETTTVVHDRPIIVEKSGSTPSDVEANCRHGYDNSSHSCY